MQFAAYEERAQDRHESDRKDGRRRHGKRLGERQGVEHLAFHSGEGEHRNERQEDDDHGEGDGAANQARRAERDLPDVLAIAAVLLAVLLGLANHVFRHHDAGVYQHANSDGNATQRHDVGTDVRGAHEQEGTQHGQRERNGNDENAAEMPEKQNVRQRDQDDFFDERVAQRAHGVINENATIVEWNDLHVRRKTGLDLVDLLLDGRNDFASVGAVADDDHSTHRFPAVLVEDAAAKLGAELHTAHIAQRDGRAVVRAQRNVLDVLEAADEADASDDVFCVADLNDLGADVVVA